MSYKYQTNMSSTSSSSKVVKINPVIFKYKMISFNINEKDDSIVIELNTGNYPIQYQYNPNSSKGHALLLKVEYLQLDKQQYKDPGLSLLFHLNSAYNFFATVVESENGIGMEVHTGIYPMAIDGSNKMIQPSNTSPSIATQNNSINIKILLPNY